MSKLIDLSGKEFNRLTVVSFSHFEKRNKSFWNCKCKCGNSIVLRGDSIKSGHVKSCGCQKIDSAKKQSFIDIKGKKFGRLTVLEVTNKRGIGRTVFWKCLCDCGKIKITQGTALRSGMVKSCGCLQLESVRKNGKFNRKDYAKTWTNKLRKLIRDLDEHKCQFPECSYSDLYEKRKLAVHHIDGNKKNCDFYNLISLCSSHHKKIEYNDPNKWKEYFYFLTEERGNSKQNEYY